MFFSTRRVVTHALLHVRTFTPNTQPTTAGFGARGVHLLPASNMSISRAEVPTDVREVLYNQSEYIVYPEHMRQADAAGGRRRRRTQVHFRAARARSSGVRAGAVSARAPDLVVTLLLLFLSGLAARSRAVPFLPGVGGRGQHPRVLLHAPAKLLGEVAHKLLRVGLAAVLRARPGENESERGEKGETQNILKNAKSKRPPISR